MHFPVPLVSFHVYRVGGFLGNDRIVKAHDKITNVYYLKGRRGIAQWELSMHADNPNGALICRVSSGFTGSPSLCEIPTVLMVTLEGRQISVEKRRGSPKGTRWFQGPDDREYHWRSIMHPWRNDMLCLDANGEIMATYRGTAMAVSKDGELRIYPPGQFMIDLLVATSLAIQTPNH